MEMFGETELCGDGERLGRISEELTWKGVARSCVPALDHEPRDDAMEQQAVVGVGADVADEVVAMERCVVEKNGRDGACRGGDEDARGVALCLKGEESQEGEEEGKEMFHCWEWICGKG